MGKESYVADQCQLETALSAVREAAVQTIRSLGCRDRARVDIRLTDEGIPYATELNSMPGLFPGFSPMIRLSKEANLGLADIVLRALACALERYGLTR